MVKTIMFKNWILNFLLNIRDTNYQMEYLEIKNLIKEKKLIEFQEKSLRKLLLHAYKNVPYYAHIFDEVGIVRDSEVCDLSKFNKIPILTKDKIKKNFQSLISKDYDKRKWFYYSSGGTTGEPFKFIQDTTYTKWSVATSRYYRDIIGISNKNLRNVYLWGSDREIFESRRDIKERLQNWLTNTKNLNAFNMNEENMEKYIKTINSSKPEFIIGYASSLYDLCQYVEREKCRLFTPKIIISTAEKLRDDMRQKIEEMFGTKVFDFYGSREAASIAGECKHNSMHIFSFNNLIEIVDKNDQLVKKNGEGRIIITNLHNYSMPLIRYDIGDIAVLGDKACKCGNPLPTLKKFSGRTLEHFVRDDESIIPAEFFMYLFITYYKKEKIKKYQVIQEDYKKIKILIVQSDVIGEQEIKDFEDKIKVAMGKDTEIVWKFVDDIPKTPSGKYLYTKSKVSTKL